jgi:hypothetical protein
LGVTDCAWADESKVHRRFEARIILVRLRRTKTSLSQIGHLDSTRLKHHDAMMRTTVTLDSDVAKMLQDEMHRSHRSFKHTLNTAIRSGLSRNSKASAAKPFKVKARSMGLRAGFDPARLNQLADELEIDAFMEKNKRLKRS